jgi:hypothetical protein
METLIKLSAAKEVAEKVRQPARSSPQALKRNHIQTTQRHD